MTRLTLYAARVFPAWGLLVVIVGTACRVADERGYQPVGGAGEAALGSLLDGLAEIPSTFSKDSTYQVWEYQGDTTLFHVISERRASAVPALVARLDQPALSMTTIGGRRVPVGVIYYRALTRLAYYEWDCGDSTSLADELCDGWPQPDATPVQLRAARRAWEKALSMGIVIRTK